MATRRIHHKEQALAELEKALSIAVPEGHIRVFVDLGAPMHMLLLNYQSHLKSKLSNGVDSESLHLLKYSDKLLDCFSQPVPLENQDFSSISEPLSERELEVLRLISTGRSNKEIADLLVITLSTVKTHINRLYSKLGAQRRTEAIRIARERGLLPD